MLFLVKRCRGAVATVNVGPPVLPPPPVQRHGDMVQFSGAGAVALSRMLRWAVPLASQRDGIAVPKFWRQTLDLVREAAAEAISASPASDIRERPSSAQWLTSKETADLLGLTDRHVRHIARQLGGRKGRGGGWMFNATDIDAEAQRRKMA
jgi:hypothetical protein